MTEYKPLTPNLRLDINIAFDEQIEEKAQRFLTRWIARTQSDIDKKKHKDEKLSKHIVG